MSILSSALGVQKTRRRVRIIVQDADCLQDPSPDVAGLDRMDAEYLSRRGAFDFPPADTVDALLHVYFERVHPNAPILQRAHFISDYEQRKFSPFLLQSMLANVVPYASEALIQDAGFPDRATAQRSFFLKAKRLYDFGHEKSQLRLLQGCIMLSSLSFSYSVDYDFHFWFNNAVRTATQLGLHRDSTIEATPHLERTLLRRLQNLQRIHDSDFDTAPLDVADFEPGDDDGFAHAILCKSTNIHKLYLVHACQIAVMTSRFVSLLSRGVEEFDLQGAQRLESDLLHWRTTLPTELRADIVYEWSAANVWILVLAGISYRFQSLLYRTLAEQYRLLNHDLSALRALLKQEAAMFELGTIIRRIILHDLIQTCPLSLTTQRLTCTSTLLALRIEMALKPDSSPIRKLRLQPQMYEDLEHLKESSRFWTPLRWPVKMFEVVLARNDLKWNPAQSSVRQPPTDQNVSTSTYNSQSASQTAGQNNYVSSTDDPFSAEGLNASFCEDRDTESWLQELLSCGFAV
ncbi:Cutinase transcription factor 1 beta [Cercospora beticola]|uniref:Cutinase transcription factor 1 beta n=1 Tax=Cercospora beticola TaxID=122368 RepID=A0A2G5HNL1_CERBT|nr:Cutinase transcription factor 1 beta [Cercospora beticola]PIA94147.1 Cutinase transcription factor 1 beta [Cercospora beticola]WPB05239.1 hypothetical protein RHO25_009891 [Cercospora beticola]